MLKNGNVKLGSGGVIWNYNLPRSTCLHKTEYCDKYCYAKRGHFPCPNVQKLMHTNLEETKRKDFVELMSAQITMLRYEKKIEAVRQHACGDFYSNAYYQSWCKICKKFPDIVFLAYTRNWEIDFSKKPKNFVIYNSLDPGQKKNLNKTLKLKAFVVEPGEVENETKHMAPDKVRNSRVCNSHCYECKYCYTGKGNVTFVRRTR